MNISSAIINSDNSGIASMGTDQIIDLFSLEGGKEKEKVKTGGKAIEGLSALWDEGEYDDLEVDDFLLNLKNRRT